MLQPIEIPPGVSRKGTVYQSRGRYYDSDLIRFASGVVGPIGGWTARTTSAMTGKPRAMVVWRDNTASLRFIAVGTHSKLYAFTPSGVAPCLLYTSDAADE